MIWLVFGSFVAAAIAIALRPLLAAHSAVTRTRSDLAFYREQLAEIERDECRGLISADDAVAARTEIKRRILKVSSASPDQDQAAPATGKATAVGVAVAVAALSFAVYLTQGHPTLPARIYDAAAEQRALSAAPDRELKSLVTKLVERLGRQPNEREGWRLLGWSYLQLGRSSDAVNALERAIALDRENGALYSMLGEALVRKANGTVTPDALAAFANALKRDPRDARARFYKGLALTQAGKDREAFDAWVEILREGPSDAEWYSGLRAQAVEMAKKLKLDPSAIP